MGIKVNQFDTTGKLVAVYDSYSTAAAHLELNESSIRRAVTANSLVKGKFYFEDTTLSTIEAQIDGLYEIGTPSELAKFNNNLIEVEDTRPKILLLDIETAPLRAYTWGVWKQNISTSQIISNWYMISWAGKWLGKEGIFSDVLDPNEAITENDGRIVGNLWRVLNEADIIIAHNGDNFDIPKINTRFVLHGLMPPSVYRQIDTLTIARQRFGFTSNSLDALAKLFEFDGKVKTEFSLWKDCMVGNVEALNYMNYYCRQDITTLEQVFMKLRPFAKGLPNLDLYQDNTTPVCPACGHTHIEIMLNKFFYTQAVKYQTYRCTSCGSISRAKTGIKFENKRQISSIPR